MSKPPSQPDSHSWHFVQELKEPLIRRVRWPRKEPATGEADLRKGVCLEWGFPDSQSLLFTARESLARLLESTGLALEGVYRIRVLKKKTGKYESFQLKITAKSCEILAGDSEGIRRAIYCLEEQLLASDGPFLRCGKICRSPVIETRISRCFFGPIKRPPKNRDELADDENYYPDEYLNRLAHEGVNGLWLTASFHELCPSRFFPEFGGDAQRRIRKLRETVARCARYGIGIYVFCIEPRGFGDNPEYLHSPSHLKRLPELAGHREGAFTFFCTSTATGRAYLEEATEFLFSEVPGLAGLMTINMGERPTHCYSNMLWDSGPNNCPRCSRRKPEEVFRDTLAAMQRGMHKGNPKGKLISWLYVPSVLERSGRSINDFYEEVARIAARVPRGVLFQYNFESMGTVSQLGRRRLIRDYSLAYVGPSRVFETCARRAVAAKIAVSAKLQVGCSHEVATVPWVPVPGNLYRKYRAMHRLGVRAAMQCWYFGNYPSLMTRAAGRLSFSPLPRTERAFLLDLARPVWGSAAPLVAEAWEHFGAAYREFPANVNFAWFGPVHDSVAWPLHLKPVDRGVAPSWLLGFPPSGDRIGECIGSAHSLDEILILCDRMTRHWENGMACLKKISSRRAEWAEEIGVAEALGIQLQSASNVLKFYQLREKLFRTETGNRQARLSLLRNLKHLVQKEIHNSQRLAELSQTDSRLGFHSEAEGYKYFPDLLRWRGKELRKILTKDFPCVEKNIRSNRALFPNHTGAVMKDGIVCCKKSSKPQKRLSWSLGKWRDCPAEKNVSSGWQTKFKVEHEADDLIFRIVCDVPENVLRNRKPAHIFDSDSIEVLVEPRRLWPASSFFVGVSGEHFDLDRLPDQTRWTSRVEMTDSGWRVTIRIPLGLLNGNGQRMRINVIRRTPEAGVFSWKKLHPLPNRLLFADRNPCDLGWLALQPPESL
ncbi:MAG: hypothetical protein IAE94_09785 [Chthoniobacterales bacterium]|nr:hypothetical protein [Chthoniobacterales bacterium]